MSDDTRAEFEAWFHAAYGPPPADEWLLANLAEAARLEAFMGGAWAAWQHCRAQVTIAGVAERARVLADCTVVRDVLDAQHEESDAQSARADEFMDKVAAVLAEKYGTEPTP